MNWWLMLSDFAAVDGPKTTRWIPVRMSDYAAMSAASIGATLRGPFNSRDEAREAA